MNATRRNFLKGLAAAAGVGLAGGAAYGVGSRAGRATLERQSSAPASTTPAETPAAQSQSPGPSAGVGVKSLVVIQLAGGNDGLATLLPYADPALQANRSTLAFPDDQLLKLNDQLALHPNLKALKGLWD